MTFEETTAYYKNAVDEKLKEYMRSPSCPQDRLIQAMDYSLNGGGKRIRAILTLQFAVLCGGNEKAAMPAACAIEMMHAFSLIHDDLPCMDDDDMRRGRPSCHKAFDEATALLAGDALELYPFVLLSDSVKCGVSPENVVKMIRTLALYAGHEGMTGGQEIDTFPSAEPMNAETILKMYELKTSRLLQAAAAMGCLSAGADEKTVQTAEKYALKLGLAFQIVDDILDICGDESVLGKPVGSDARQGKRTYAETVGVEQARLDAKRLTDEALEQLKRFNGSDYLRQLTFSLLNRNK